MTHEEITRAAQMHRRALHRIPELDDELTETCSYVRGVLSSLRCTVTEPAKSSLCAYFDFGRQDTVAWRTDMDALPVTETADVPYASCHPGKMHACGHDGHTAMALTLAQLLDAADDMPHNVLIVFQPAEETTGGAKKIVESGVFETYHVTRIFGMHMWPDLPFGTIGTKAGPMFAKSSETNVDIIGKSTHIARAADGADALEAGARFLLQAYDMVAHEVPPEEPKLLKFGMLQAGTVRNALAASAALRGSLRSFTPSVFEYMKRRLFEIADEVSTATGAQVQVRLNEGYPPVMNDEGLFREACKALTVTELTHPSMTAEDFSFYQEVVPGLFLCLGTGGAYPLHSDKFDIDDTVLGIGVEAALTLLKL